MSKDPFTYILAHLLGIGFMLGVITLCVAGIEWVVGVVTPYEPVILKTLETDRVTH